MRTVRGGGGRGRERGGRERGGEGGREVERQRGRGNPLTVNMGLRICDIYEGGGKTEPWQNNSRSRTPFYRSSSCLAPSLVPPCLLTCLLGRLPPSLRPPPIFSSLCPPQFGSQPAFPFAPKDHVALGAALDLFDFDTAAEVRAPARQTRVSALTPRMAALKLLFSLKAVGHARNNARRV